MNKYKDTFGSSDQDIKDNSKSSINYNDFELFKKEDYKKNLKNPVIRVKRVFNSKSEKWKIFEDTKNTLILEGEKLTNKEKEFLRTVDGFNFLIGKYREGVRSFNALKKEIKEKLKG